MGAWRPAVRSLSPEWFFRIVFCCVPQTRPQPRLRVLTDPNQEVNVYGPFTTLAYMYADVYLGSPPQKATVILDTGSTLLAVAVASCGSQCGAHQDPHWDPVRSSTASQVTCGAACPQGGGCSGNQCTFVVSYAEGSSITGLYYRDLVWIGDDSSNLNNDAGGGVMYNIGGVTRETRECP